MSIRGRQRRSWLLLRTEFCRDSPRPNIKPVPLGTPIPDTLSCSVAIKVGDNVSTDEIAPTGAGSEPLGPTFPRPPRR